MRPDKRHTNRMLWGKKFGRKHEDKHLRLLQIKPSESEAKPKSEKMASVFGRQIPNTEEKILKMNGCKRIVFFVNMASVFLYL